MSNWWILRIIYNSSFLTIIPFSLLKGRLKYIFFHLQNSLLRRGSFSGETGKERENGESKKSGAREGRWEGSFLFPSQCSPRASVSVLPSSRALYFPSPHSPNERDLCGGESLQNENLQKVLTASSRLNACTWVSCNGSTFDWLFTGNVSPSKNGR